MMTAVSKGFRSESGVSQVKVYIVGAGPGDPGLITVKGLRCVQAADVLVYDRLVHPDLLAEAPPSAERIYVGKEQNHHSVPQEGINALMVEKAMAGKTVVRLKGGDPFVFGRGAEEVLYLLEHGVACEVVPGVSSATAVPAYAGIPITHREYSSMVSIITGHETFYKTRPPLRFDLIAPNDSTLVILMGMTNIERLTEELVRHGRPAHTPACVISWGTYPQQHIVTGSLADIASRVSREKVSPPGVIVIGEVVRFRETFLKYGGLYGH
jgi:uroporphyrin-III C-methyltransferase